MYNQPLLIETIRIQNGRVRNIAYHNYRCNAARKKLFNNNNPINLRACIDTSKAPSQLTKCRITYTNEVQTVEYEAYEMKAINSLQVIEDSTLDYSVKYKDRDALAKLYKNKGRADEILITQNGLITDTYYANVALLQDGIWHTPTSPLLKGTMRAYLLEKKRIQLADIHKKDIKKYSKIAIFNAMIPFGNIILDTDKIYL